jgi:hypothetical protein
VISLASGVDNSIIYHMIAVAAGEVDRLALFAVNANIMAEAEFCDPGKSPAIWQAP